MDENLNNASLQASEAGAAEAAEAQAQSILGGAGSPAKQAEAAPSAAEAPPFERLVGADGQFAENWRAALPEEIRGEKCLDSIKCIQALAKSYVAGQKAMGAQKVALPGKDATEEEKAAFYKALGRPDTPEGYGIKAPESLPEGVQWDEGKAKRFAQFAFDNGLTPSQVQAALAFQDGLVREAIQAEADARERGRRETEERLKREYGSEYPRLVEQCNKTLRTFGLEETLREHNLLSDYGMIQALARIGASLSESRLAGGQETRIKGTRARIEEITGDLSDPFYDRSSPRHAARVAEVARLMQEMQ